jgi:hypothetical protein
MQNHYRGKREPRKGEMEEISHSRRISKLKVQREKIALRKTGCSPHHTQ